MDCRHGFCGRPLYNGCSRTPVTTPGLRYAEAPASYWQSIIDWLDYLHGWKVKREWITYIPGIVKGIGLAVNVFSNPGDKIIIQTPVYTPFMAVPESNGRQVVHNPLKWNGSHYEMDFDHLESIIDSQCKLFILCNPHNPGGVVWPLETLQRIAEICARHNILIIADEITASLDPDTSGQVMENLLALPCMVVAITHDVSGAFMKQFDKVYRVEHGSVTQA